MSDDGCGDDAGEPVELGPVTLLDDLPTVVSPPSGGRFVLSADGDGPVLFSAVCPHQRGRVRVSDGETLVCPNHRWEFDAETGACTSGQDASLEAVPVERENGTLYALVDGS
ncbi:Rieske (2Fe-2S) protein [Haloarchaeobius sp. HRN-SO-5]|uniref:Rieske (2Fe-2S) protein n=1 Tax=Haloarchaeobius sp. HRN-SO-5 TaxID=3446118 RepID=UPI003EB8A5FA